MDDEGKKLKKQTHLSIDEVPSCSHITEKVLLGEDTEWKIRNLTPSDLNDVIKICSESFPLEYPEYWYKEVVERKFISYGLFHSNTLTSLLVAEIKTVAECDLEDRTLFSECDSTRVVYILSLAVRDSYRRRGIATILLEHLIRIIANEKFLPKIIFLHVLAENFVAINFYKRNGFYHFATLRDYYQINNVYYDGFTMVCYLDKKKFNNLSGTSNQTLWWSPKNLCNLLSVILSTPFRLILRLKPPFVRF